MSSGKRQSRAQTTPNSSSLGFAKNLGGETQAQVPYPIAPTIFVYPRNRTILTVFPYLPVIDFLEQAAEDIFVVIRIDYRIDKPELVIGHHF